MRLFLSVKSYLSRPVTNAREAQFSATNLLVSLILAAGLSGCATTQTRYVTIGCLTQSQYDQLAAAKPGKIHSQLNGSADHDEKLIAGRLIRVEAWGEGELTILGGCITKDAH